jgi:carbamoyltransferase
MRDRINLEINGRERFRPLALAVPWDNASECFQIEQESPYMLMAVLVRPEMRDIIPAVAHLAGLRFAGSLQEPERFAGAA